MTVAGPHGSVDAVSSFVAIFGDVRRQRRAAFAVAAFVLVLAGALIVVAVVQAGSARTLPRNGKIVFAGSNGFYTINPDGSGLKLILRTIANKPDWSPDGRQIAFAGLGGIAVMNADGSHPHSIVVTPGNSSDPSWSPDGTRIAFTRVLPGNRAADLWVVNVRTHALLQLTRTPQVIESTPDRSPDGTRIMVGETPRSIVYPPTVLRTVDAYGRQHIGFVSDISSMQAVWSPDGSQIAFTASDLSGRGSDIWVMNADRTDPRDLTAGWGVTNVNPAWSPDGKQLVFRTSRDDTNGHDLWTIDADGSNPKRVTNFGQPGAGTTQPPTPIAGYPAWEPLPD